MENLYKFRRFSKFMDFSGFYGVSLRVFGEARQTVARRIRIVLGTAGGSHLPKLIRVALYGKVQLTIIINNLFDDVNVI